LTTLLILARWWPASRAGFGRVLATTRRGDAALTGADRALITIDAYVLVPDLQPTAGVG
jgi:hypothetical protein